MIDVYYFTCSVRSPQLTAIMLVGTVKQRLHGHGSVYESTQGNHNLHQYMYMYITKYMYMDMDMYIVYAWLGFF